MCRCNGTGTVLIEGPCDAAPAEVPCACLAQNEDSGRVERPAALAKTHSSGPTRVTAA